MTKTKLGALLWCFCLQYFLAETVAISGWLGPYSLRFDYISDLGALGCSAARCSPLHAVMNGSFLLQGVLIVGGTALLWPLFAPTRLAVLAMGLVGASGIGVFLVGLAPEDYWPPIHYFGAAENFLCCNLGMAAMGLSWLYAGSRPALGGVSLAVGLVGLTGIALLGAGNYFGLGVGSVERIVAYPFPLWLAVLGSMALRRTAPSMTGERIRLTMRLIMAAFYFAAGLLHLRSPAPFLAIVPDWVPWPREVVMFTGLCELAGAVALLTRRLRLLAGVMLALYAVCVFPANLKHAFYDVQVPGLPTGWAYHAPRLALQPVLVWWALFCAGVVDWPFGRALRKDSRG